MVSRLAGVIVRTKLSRSRRWALAAPILALAFTASFELPALGQARTMTWSGRTWRITNGGMVGVCEGNPANVSVDSNGYLHMRITNTNGVWTAAEIFTTVPLGFGTYQWHIDAPIDLIDQNVVVGLFPYGPVGPRTNEIDIEYARWGLANGPNADWVVYPASGTVKGSLAYSFTLNGGTLSTSRFIWGSTSVFACLLGGIEPPNSLSGLIRSWTYTPANPTVNIPQKTLPLGMNFWCFNNPPSNGQDVEIVVRDFQFVPEGTIIDGGAGGVGSDAGQGGGGGNGGGGADGGGGVGAGGGGAANGGAGGAPTSGGTSGTGEPPAGTTSGGTSMTGGGSSTDPPSCGTSGPQTQPFPPGSSGCGCKLTTKGSMSAGSVAGLLFALLAMSRRSRLGRQRVTF